MTVLLPLNKTLLVMRPKLKAELADVSKEARVISSKTGIPNMGGISALLVSPLVIFRPPGRRASHW